MAKAIEIQLKGFRELGELLRDFGPKVAKNGLRTATFAGAKVIREAVKARAPVDTGRLRDSVAAFRRRSPENVAKYSIGFRTLKRKYGNTKQNRRLRRVGKTYAVEPPAFYARFIEKGTSKMAARPFIRPAFDATVGQALDAIKAGLSKAVLRAAAKR